jgi:tripeptide aminopeptidase
MRLGRIDAGTTANVGTIEGGSAVNVVPDRCRVAGEVRSLDAARAEQLASELAECLADAANDPECECDLDLTLERQFDGYRVRASSREVTLAFGALRDCGIEPVPLVTGGGSDVNVLRARGLAALNLSNGTERNHEPGERVATAALDTILDIAFALVERAGVT